MSSPSGRSDELAISAWQAMRTIVLELNDRRPEVAATLGMSFVRIKALRRLTRGPMTMRELAGELAVDAPYTTLVVDDLEQRGLVERKPDATDRRRKIVAVTPAGRVIANRAQRILDVPPSALAALPESDLAELDRIMRAALARSSDEIPA
jgi:DNA-binding MarR family transcriptional regulator